MSRPLILAGAAAAGYLAARGRGGRRSWQIEPAFLGLSTPVDGDDGWIRDVQIGKYTDGSVHAYDTDGVAIKSWSATEWKKDPNYSKIEKDWVRGGHAARGRAAMMPPGHWMRRLGYGTLFLSTFARGGLPNREQHGRRAKRTTIATVNRALRERGIPGNLVRGRGYYYMMSREEDRPELFWETNYGGDSIYVYSISDWSVDSVIEEIERLGGQELVAYRKRQGRSARSYNRRVSKCISGKVREGWEQHSAVGACLSMDRDKRLRADGSYIKGRRSEWTVGSMGSLKNWSKTRGGTATYPDPKGRGHYELFGEAGEWFITFHERQPAKRGDWHRGTQEHGVKPGGKHSTITHHTDYQDQHSFRTRAKAIAAAQAHVKARDGNGITYRRKRV